MQRTVSTSAGEIAYELTRKRVKNGNLRVHADGSVHVSVPQRSPLAFADELVRQRAGWIVRTRERLAARQPTVPADGGAVWLLGERCRLELVQGRVARLEQRGNTLCGTLPDPADTAAVTVLLRRFVERTYRPVFEASLDRMLALAAPLNLARPELHMRWMTSRWGSCTMAKGKITINWALVGATPADIDAVVLHELVHFRHPDHSAAFYRTLYALMPDYPQRHARVRQLPAGFWKLT